MPDASLPGGRPPGSPWDGDPSSGQRPPEGLVGGRYRLVKRLGQGGMAVVWQGRDEVLNRDVAVKEVLPPRDLSPGVRDEILQRAMREARTAARLTHPSVVRVYDVVEDGGRPWIVMELLPPRTLSDVLATDGPLAPQAAARLGEQLLSALRTAHAAGVLHRDVKPSNVMITDDGRAVLTDFGIATVEGDPSLTATGTLVGSPGYMAPERARGESPTAASDLWSLGATLFTATEGSGPFEREGQLATLNAVISQDAPPASHAGPLGPLIARLLDRDPVRRPSAREAHEELGRIAAGRPGTMTVPVADAGADGRPAAPGQGTTEVIRTPATSTRRLPVGGVVPPGSLHGGLPGSPPGHPGGNPAAGAAPSGAPGGPYGRPTRGAPYGPATAALPGAGPGFTGRRGNGPWLVVTAVLVVAVGVLALLLLRPGLGGFLSPGATSPSIEISQVPSPAPTTSEPGTTSAEPSTTSADVTESPTSESESSQQTEESTTSEASPDNSSPGSGDGGTPTGPATDSGPGGGDGGGGADGGGDGGGGGSPTASG